MKRIIGVLSLMVSFVFVYSQTTLSFCAWVEQNGYCDFNNIKFITTPDSTYGKIFLRINNPHGIATSKITYKIFTVDKAGKETFSHSLEQNIQKEWDTSWQPENFASPGKFNVKVYNDSDVQICGKSFELFRDW